MILTDEQAYRIIREHNSSRVALSRTEIALIEATEQAVLSKLSSTTLEEKIAHVIKLMNTDVRDCPQYPRRREMCTEDCETCLARQIMSLCYNPDKVREVLMKRMGQKWVKCRDCKNTTDYTNMTKDECVDCAVKEICGG